MNNNEEKKLFEAMEKYSETHDSDLITEEVYEQYKRYIQFVSKRYSIFEKEPIDIKVSIVDKELWKRIKLFDNSKASMATFLSVIIKTALLMEARNRNAIKNRTDNLVSFDDIVIDSDNSYNREVRRYEVIGKYDDNIPIFEIMELFNKGLESYLNTRNPKIRNKIKDILIMHINDYDQKSISIKSKHSQSYVNRVIKDFNKYMNFNKKRFV